MKTSILTVAFAATITTAALAATAGDPDPGFGQNGRTTLGLDVYPSQVLTQPDGKVIVADQNVFRLLRLNVDGTPDKDFAGDGIASAEPVPGATVNAAAVQPDESVLAVGSAKGLTAVVSFRRDGVLDRRFDPEGTDGPGIKVGGLATDTADAVAVQPNGQIVIVGLKSGIVGATRLDPDGRPDNTIYEPVPAGNRSVTVHAAAVGPAGELVIAGSARGGTPADEDVFVARYTSTGKLDKGFSDDGVFDAGPADRDDSALGLAIGPDGKIVLTGSTGTGATSQIVVTKLRADGKPDDTFGTGGRALPVFGAQAYAADAIGLQPDGKILVGGTSEQQLVAARLTTAGSLDTTFGTGGKVSVKFAEAATTYGGVLQPDGGFVLAGITAVDNLTKLRTAVARVLGDQPGTPTPTATASPTVSATPTPTATPAADTTAPVLDRLKVVKAKRGRRARVRFVLTEAGRVEIALKRRGRRVARTTRTATEGSNRLQVGRKLMAGRYRLVAAPIDAAGNAGVARRVRFAVR